jgi:hypothetical protein
MIYAILIHGSEARYLEYTPQEDQELMDRHANLRADLTAAGRLGPVMRLDPLKAKVVRRYKDRRYITDGPFAETKEQLMGLYVVDVETFEDAVAAAERLNFDTGVFEIVPAPWLHPGFLQPVTPQRSEYVLGR